MTYLKSKKMVFHSDFGCLEGGGGKHPPTHHLMYIFNLTANRVKSNLWRLMSVQVNLYTFREQWLFTKVYRFAYANFTKGHLKTQQLKGLRIQA